MRRGRRIQMKTLRTHEQFTLVKLASMVILCVAVGLLGTQQRAEAWSAGPLFGLDSSLPPGGAHGMMAEHAVNQLVNNLLPAGYLSARERQLLREGASTPDSIWGIGAGMKNTLWSEAALQLESLIGRDVVELDIFEGYSCTDEPCFTLKDDWENDFDNLMNHEFADLSVWNPIKYWADKAKQDLINNNRNRAMVHAGYAMHFAEDFLNPAHLGPLLWGSYQEVDWSLALELDWENNDFYYVPKAWSFSNFRIFGRCFTSVNAFPISFENDLLSYRRSNALAWPDPPDLAWIIDQGKTGVVLDQRIANAVMWSEQAAHEVLQYVFDLAPPGGCISPTNIVDFNGDGKTDIAVYHSASGLWFIKPSSGVADYYMGYGGSGYVPVPGDYDGDGKTDIAVYHSASGLWFIKPSSGTADYYVGYGGPDYKPVPGDYDGDRKADIAAYHSPSGLWFIKPSSGAADYYVGYGGPDYKPVPGDYDGDRKADIAAYHSPSGLWFIKPSSGAADYWLQWGGVGCIPVPGDYDGDGKTDVAIYHQASGDWIIEPSSGAGYYYVGYGGTGYAPVPGDYDGDGKVDIAVYHSASGLWFIKPSSGTADYYVGYGGANYTPVNLDYLHGYVY